MDGLPARQMGRPRSIPAPGVRAVGNGRRNRPVFPPPVIRETRDAGRCPRPPVPMRAANRPWEAGEHLTVVRTHPEALCNRGGHAEIWETLGVLVDCDARYVVDSPTRCSSDAKAIARCSARSDTTTRRAHAGSRETEGCRPTVIHTERGRPAGHTPNPKRTPLPSVGLLFDPVCKVAIPSNPPGQNASSPDHDLRPSPKWLLAHL